MNHIYRRIWNKAKQCWVVTSEISAARTSGMLCNRSAHLVALVALPLATAIAGSVNALPLEAVIQCDQEEDQFKQECGFLPQLGAKSMAGSWSYEAGGGWAIGNSSVALGYAAMATEHYSVALGVHAEATAFQTVAMGFQARAWGVDSVAIGMGSKTNGGHNVAIGAYAEAHYIGAMSVGNRAKADAQNAISIGSGSASSVEGAVAFGANSRARAKNAIALGASSVADEADTVSVGNTSTRRRIVNVADARLTSSSTDAVTGKQLYATNSNVSTARSVADSAKSNADSALSKANALSSLLSQTSASGNVRVGGSNSGTVLDIRNSANASRKITGVADATLSTTSTGAVSGKQLNTTNSNVAAARSVADSAKINADSALSKANTLSGLLSQTSASGNVRVGASNSGTVLDVRNNANASRKITGVADATLSTTSTEAVSGRQLNTTNSNVTAARSIADSAKTNADSALTKANTLSGLLSQTSASGNVRLGATNSGTVLDVRNSANASRKITGVADAALSSTSTDAVTGRQLNTTNSNVSTALSDATAAKVAANSALTQVGTLNGLLGQASASGNVRVGEKNNGTVLDVRNSANGNRKLTGVADGVVDASSYEAVNGRQLNATNDKVATVESIARSAGTEAAVAKTDAAMALAETAVLGGLVAQASPAGSVRLGERNSGSLLDVHNSLGLSRRITGVANGVLSLGSNDAVNGGQLYTTNTAVQAATVAVEEAGRRIGEIEGKSKFMAVGAPIDDVKAQAGRLGIALGDSAEASLVGEGGVAIGSYAKARATNSVAIGRASGVAEDAENGFALGSRSRVEEANGLAVGAGSYVQKGATNSVALGNGSIAEEASTVSVGGGLLKRRLVNVERGTADHNATTVSQLNDSLAPLGGGAGMDGNGNIIAPTYTVQGGTQNTVEDAMMALDGAVITAGRRADKVEGQLNSIFQDSPSARTDGMSQIALNGVNGMVLTNLADGRVAPGSRDAVNGGQLHSMQQQLNGRMDGLEQRIDDAPAPRALASSSVPKPQAEETPVVPEGKDSQQVASVGEGDKPTPQPKANKDDSPKPQVDTAELEKMLARANEYTDGAISNFERRLDKMDKRFNRMAAMSSAQSAMAMNTAGLATYNRLGAGVGYSEGESAMAVGYQRVLNEKGSATFSLNGAFTNSGERSMGVGVGIGW